MISFSTSSNMKCCHASSPLHSLCSNVTGAALLHDLFFLRFWGSFWGTWWTWRCPVNSCCGSNRWSQNALNQQSCHLTRLVITICLKYGYCCLSPGVDKNIYHQVSTYNQRWNVFAVSHQDVDNKPQMCAWKQHKCSTKTPMEKKNTRGVCEDTQTAVSRLLSFSTPLPALCWLCWRGVTLWLQHVIVIKCGVPYSDGDSRGCCRLATERK